MDIVLKQTKQFLNTANLRLKQFVHDTLLDTTKTDNVLLLEDDLFFIDTIQLKRSFLSVKTLSCLVKLRVESICPFDPEEALYGYIWRKKDQSLTIFIAYKPRVEARYHKLAEYNYILPLSFCDTLYGSNYNIQSAEVLDDSIVFHTPSQQICFRLISPKIYHANLADIKRKTRDICRTSLTKVFEYGSYFCLSLICLLFCSSGVVAGEAYKLRAIDKQLNGAQIEEIRSKDLLSNKLKRFLQSKDFCLSGLNTLNKLRPDGMVFQNACVCTISKLVNIRGQARSITEIMNYQRALEQLTEISRATLSHVHAKDREAFFDLEVKFE